MGNDELLGSIDCIENKTKPDAYYVRMRVPQPDGTTSQYPQRFGPFESESEARQKQIELNHKFNEGEYFEDADVTVGQYMSWWIENYVSSTQGNYDQYRLNIKNHVNPTIGHKALGDVTKFDLEKLFREKAEEGYSKGQVKDIRKVIHKAFSDAVEGVPEKLLRENPASKAEIPKMDDPQITIFTKDQKEEFLELASKEKFNIYGPVYEVDFDTGLRRGELLGLFWSDSLDLDRGELTVHRQVNPSRELTDPKTPASKRTIGITDSLIETLREFREKKQDMIEKKGDDFKRPDVVFTSTTTDLIWPNKLNENFRAIREEMGLSEDYTIQSIRHTHATWLLRQGHSPTAVARRLGHSDTDTIFRHYRKYAREEDQALVEDLEENF
ncbi:MAG: tyrosine-type recombinase/integrase [bacterium]